jgi:hypothetical protein
LQRLKLQCDELLSSSAFKFNVRRYAMDKEAGRRRLLKMYEEARGQGLTLVLRFGFVVQGLEFSI